MPGVREGRRACFGSFVRAAAPSGAGRAPAGGFWSASGRGPGAGGVARGLQSGRAQEERAQQDAARAQPPQAPPCACRRARPPARPPLARSPQISRASARRRAPGQGLGFGDEKGGGGGGAALGPQRGGGGAHNAARPLCLWLWTRLRCLGVEGHRRGGRWRPSQGVGASPGTRVWRAGGAVGSTHAIEQSKCRSLINTQAHGRQRRGQWLCAGTTVPMGAALNTAARQVTRIGGGRRQGAMGGVAGAAAGAGHCPAPPAACARPLPRRRSWRVRRWRL
ncbi:MAG: hypothetical protein J3K34DRAFT_412399 [Monoraphidium minutum]|nr:MAG: hypothetical protein J3K34DRAFT_412399 [Monoraphidium minutum]